MFSPSIHSSLLLPWTEFTQTICEVVNPQHCCKPTCGGRRRGRSGPSAEPAICFVKCHMCSVFKREWGKTTLHEITACKFLQSWLCCCSVSDGWAESQLCTAEESRVRRGLCLQLPSTAGWAQTQRGREMAEGGSRLYLCSISSKEKQGTETQGWAQFR